MQKELIHAGPLLNEQGELCEAGYARRLIKQYDRRAIKAAAHRIKEWDYYLIMNGRWGVALTIDGSRRLTAWVKSFMDKKPITAEFILTGEPEDSMVIVTPFAEDKKAFYYNQKINCMKAAGRVEFDGQVIEFSPEDTYATLDWGRGVWTYKNTWYWGSGNGTVAGKPFGFNIGYGFGDTGAASENMLFYDGTAHKLDRLTFLIPQKDGRDDFMSPWLFTSSDGRFEMDFTPVLDRASCTSVGIICSDQHQVFGCFNGTATLDDGTVLKIENLLGFAEKVYNKW